MAKLGVRDIYNRAIEILATCPGGMRYIDLVRSIASESPETPYNTIFTQIGSLPNRHPEIVYRPQRGLFMLREGIPPSDVLLRQENLNQRKLENTEANLYALGFVEVGAWEPCGDAIRCVIHLHANRNRILYAFVVDGKVMYVGKSRRTLSQRIYNYQKFGATQLTNIRNNGHIRAALAAGKKVKVLALVDWVPVEHRGIPINVAAGIEDELIENMRPPWNG